MKEVEIIEKKDLRDQFIDRVEVLEKVKSLLLLPDVNLATTQQVADFYEVETEAIRQITTRNKDEIQSDGYVVWKAEDFNSDNLSQLKITTQRGSFRVEFSDGNQQRFSPRGVALFPRRAILRVGMLLRDSEVAKEVRTQLLNIEEKTTEQQKVSSITEEQQLMLNVMYAENDSDRLMAFSKFNEYKNRYINTLENKIEALTDGILRWNSREGVNRMVRQIAGKTFNGKYNKAWDKVYAEMLYKHNIGINVRKKKSELKKPTIFDVLNENETRLLVKSCLSLCDMYEIDTEELLMDIKQ